MECEMRILVVPGHTATVQKVTSALHEGCLVTIARESHDALAFLADGKSDLILIDASLPEAAVADLCDKLRRGDASRAVPVLFLTDSISRREGVPQGYESISHPIDAQLLRLWLRSTVALDAERGRPARRDRGCGGAQLELEWEGAFDLLPDQIAIIDTEHTFSRVNRALAEACGCTAGELVGRKCYEVLHHQDEPAADCPHARMLRDGAEHREQIQGANGEPIYEVTVSPLRDAEGALVAGVHVARDVTAKVRMEGYGTVGEEILRVLGEKESRTEGVQRVLGLVKAATGVDAVGIRLEDQDDYPFFHQEGFPDDFLQKENSLLSRMRDGGVCRDESGDICLECTCGLVISGRTDPSEPHVTGGGSYWTNDSSLLLQVPADAAKRVNARDECIHQGFSSVALIPIRAKGRVVGLLQLNAYRKGCFTPEGIEMLEAIAGNIGEALLRKQAEEKLIASERFLRTLTDQLPGMVGYWTPDLRCTFANAAYQEWFGRSAQQVIGLTARELLGEELFARNEPHMRRALKGEAQRFQRSLRKAQGYEGSLLAHYVPDVVGGETRGFFVLASDVTELKRSEEEKVKLEVQLQQAQKMESIGRLAGGVAHDFNNMLGVIIGHADLSLLKMSPCDPTYDGLLEIRDAAERSANLTRQLLAFASKQTILPRVLNLNETVSGMLKMLQRLIGEDIHLTWLPGSDLWRVKADPGQIDQILANLCVNARDAIADTGRITIRTQNSTLHASYCREHPEALPGEYVRLTLTDDGCGMEQETLANIFEPFYTTKEVGKGTGLGLATVFGIVKQNSGCIDVYSIPGQGTTFSVYLPRYDEGSQAPAEGAGGALPSGQETVLVVEDEPTILMMTAMMLQHQGYHVLVAATPDEAIEVAGKHAGGIDLLLTDVIMPQMNGKELAKTLILSYPALKCLFMSGYTADVIAHHGVFDVSANFIQKPFTFPDLAAHVRDVLDA